MTRLLALALLSLPAVAGPSLYGAIQTDCGCKCVLYEAPEWGPDTLALTKYIDAATPLIADAMVRPAFDHVEVFELVEVTADTATWVHTADAPHPAPGDDTLDIDQDGQPDYQITGPADCGFTPASALDWPVDVFE